MISTRKPPPKFHPGQLVRHARYGYRGVVVELDPYCRAPDAWYEKNQTQPPKDQAWYHVLVDGSSTVTYAAETSLTEEESPAAISHPLVKIFFGEFNGDSYVRNDHPWPDTWE